MTARHVPLAIGLIGIAMSLAADRPPDAIRTVDELWAGYDPRAEPLEIDVEKTWDEGAIRLERLRFTGETWDGAKVRVFAYRGAPREGSSLPGVLHLHGGGQTASLAWVRYWTGRGYVAVSHDFCGPHPMRKAEDVTDWAKAPARMADPNGPRSGILPNARSNQWYHWTLLARRALTLLERHPQVDKRRLGVFGISVGGTLTWMVAGIDDRVAAAVPIYGVGQNTYTFPWQKPDDPIGDDARAMRTLLEPEVYASRVRCPLLFMNASNDQHGRLDLGMRTLALAASSPALREVYSARDIHHIRPAEARDLPLWMDRHLKDEGPAWPESPKIRIEAASPGPRVVVTADRPDDVESVTVHYGLTNPWPTSRFYRTAHAEKRAGDEYAAAAPLVSGDDTIYAFANIGYLSGIVLSTRLAVADAKALPGASPTLHRTALIDSMDNDDAWFWWAAGTDPLEPRPLFRSWTGPQGERGFTQAEPGVFSFATNILGDPQFRYDGTQALLLDVLAEARPRDLTVDVTRHFFQPGQVAYKASPTLGEANDRWIALRLTPGDFRDAQGAPLSTWKGVDYLHLQGTSVGKATAAFKNLRWESIGPDASTRVD